MEEERKQFTNLDVDQDGYITNEELWIQVSNMKNKEDVMRMFNAVDMDKNGSINYSGKLHDCRISSGIHVKRPLHDG